MKRVATFLLFLILGSFAQGEDSELGRIFEKYGSAWIKERPVSTYAQSGNTPRMSWHLPMCFFFDPQIGSAAANEKIRAMVTSYATCGIALEPFVFTLKNNYPDDYKTLIAMARKACPIDDALKVRGAIQIESRYSDLPKKMCDDPKAEGCSTLCEPLSVSFVKPNAGAKIGLHESMHSNCCGPMCVEKGEGTVSAGVDLDLASQAVSDFNYRASRRESSSLQITPEGCAALVAGASPNDHKATVKLEQPTSFYPVPKYDLMAGKSFFGEIERPVASAEPADLAAVISALDAAPRKPEKKKPDLIIVGEQRKRGAGLRKKGTSDFGVISDLYE